MASNLNRKSGFSDSNSPRSRAAAEGQGAHGRPARSHVRNLNIPEIVVGQTGASKAPRSASGSAASQRLEFVPTAADGRPRRRTHAEARAAERAATAAMGGGEGARRASSSDGRPVKGERARRANNQPARDPRAKDSRAEQGYRAIPGGRPSRAADGERLHSVRIGDIPKERPARSDRRRRSARDGRSESRDARDRGRTTGERPSNRSERPRRESVRAPRRGKRLAVAVAAVCALALAALIAFFVVARSGAFQIKQIAFSGVEHLTSADVGALVVVPQGTSLLDVDVEGIRQSLLRDAWVADVSVSRSFPDTLSVNVTEREIAAVVEIPTGVQQQVRQWLLSTDGIWLMPIPAQDTPAGAATSSRVYADAETALRIVDVPYGVVPEIGAKCTDATIENALSVVSGLTTELADQVTVVSASDPESATLTLDSGVEVAFGSATNIREKERVCIQLLSEHEGAIAYINVRSPERPTWRAM